MKKAWIAALAAVVLAGLAGAVPSATGSAGSTRYVVVLAGVQGDEGFTGTGTTAADRRGRDGGGRHGRERPLEADRRARRRVELGDVRVGALVLGARRRRSARTGSSRACRTAARSRPPIRSSRSSGTWSMIRAPQAHDVQAGSRSVDVGVLDSGVDGRHPDFLVDARGSNVDCARGRNSVSFLPSGPGSARPTRAPTTSSTARTSPARSPRRRTGSASSASPRT